MNTKLQFKSFEPYSQKVQILGCYNSTPLNKNLVPRFEETREKDKLICKSLLFPDQLLSNDDATGSKPTL
jgi:hypothetical protein